MDLIKVEDETVGWIGMADKVSDRFLWKKMYVVFVFIQHWVILTFHWLLPAEGKSRSRELYFAVVIKLGST